MKFEEIKCFFNKKYLQISFKNKEVNDDILDKVITFRKSLDSYYVCYSNIEEEIEVNHNEKIYIDSLIERKKIYLAKIFENKENSEVLKKILVFEFNSEIRLDLPVFFNKENIEKKENLLKKITAEFIVNINKNDKLIILGIRRNDYLLEKKYIIIGEEKVAYLEKKQVLFVDKKTQKKEFIPEVFEIVSIEKIKRNLENYSFYLVRGKIEFIDDLKDFKYNPINSIVLDKDKNIASSYLETWRKYADLEKNANIKKAENKGEFRIIESQYQKLEGKKEVLILTLDKKCTFKEGEIITIQRDKTEWDVIVAKDLKDKRRLRINFDTRLPDKLKGSFIKSSIKGDEIMSKRRERAINLILDNKTGIENLRSIMEGKNPRKKRGEYLFALSSGTKQQLFSKYDPTENQQSAIEVALNTPDIALIQGPPGTGKTTVITAIFRRLDEERKEIGNITGKNLITSFQHDAVVNAASRIRNLAGIPAEKYGNKQNEGGRIFNKVFKDYIYETLEHYYLHEPQLEKMKEETELQELYNYYSKKIEKTPMRKEALELLKKLNFFITKYSLLDLKDDIKNLNEELKKTNIKNYSIDKRYFYKLPVCQEMLDDNGKDFIKKSIKELESKIEEKEISYENFKKEIDYLKEVLDKENEKIDFRIMKVCKNSILSKLKEIDSPFLNDLPNQKIKDFFEKLGFIITKLKEEKSSYKEEIKIRYLRELENNPLRVRDTLRNYMTTYGATCQQSQSTQIKRIKTKKEKEEKSFFLEDEEKYENVIIDEAARSNPLDLLIPMSLAEERIIFVGDHKQLPHLVDDDIIEKMEKSVKEETENLLKTSLLDDDIIEKMEKSVKKETENLLKTSMFEILVEKCKELEKIDNIKRVIMLDTQYRMHPKMGSFISENFYEGKLKNGLSADKFKTTLKGLEGKAFAWFDIPYKKEYEEKSINNSKFRKIEAKEIAKFLYKNIDSEENEGKTFGVITFYAEQREEIYKELANEKNKAYQEQEFIVKRSSKNGKYEISEKYLKEGYEKLRIGSVDSFQGMEFNYVCLSMVRSNKISQSNLRSKFGFLLNPNRLCVAMSRQKELVIMFGDSEMLEAADHEDTIALQKYLKMCKEEREYGYFGPVL